MSCKIYLDNVISFQGSLDRVIYPGDEISRKVWEFSIKKNKNRKQHTFYRDP